MGVALESLDSARVWQEEGIVVEEVVRWVWQEGLVFVCGLGLKMAANAVDWKLDLVYTCASVVYASIQS